MSKRKKLLLSTTLLLVFALALIPAFPYLGVSKRAPAGIARAADLSCGVTAYTPSLSGGQVRASAGGWCSRSGGSSTNAMLEVCLKRSIPFWFDETISCSTKSKYTVYTFMSIDHQTYGCKPGTYTYYTDTTLEASIDTWKYIPDSYTFDTSGTVTLTCD